MALHRRHRHRRQHPPRKRRPRLVQLEVAARTTTRRANSSGSTPTPSSARRHPTTKNPSTDFQHIFLGKGGNTGPLIVTYNRDELVRDLNQVLPYDWAAFIHERIDTINPRADLAGIERGGYRLVYTDKPNPSEKIMSENGSPRRRALDVWYSLGLRVTAEGVISDVRWGGPADKARLAPGQKILGVNGQAFSPDLLKDAIVAAHSNAKPDPIHLLTESDTFLATADIDYHDGMRYPHLERIEGAPAYLDDITKPLTPQQSAPEKPGDDED